MANLTEANTWDVGVYRIETTDPVLGGPSGPANAGAINLANRTHWLRNQIAGLGGTVAWVEVVQTATGNWTCPANVTEVLILDMCAAGGGGAGAYDDTGTASIWAGGGGGEGARVSGVALSVVPATVYTLTIGAAGTAGATSASHNFGTFGVDSALFGGDGGSTSFGALLTCTGGKGAGNHSNTFGADYVLKPGVGGTVTISAVVHAGGTGESGWPVVVSSAPNARGGGVAGGYAWLERTGATTYAAAYAAPGPGCGGCGGKYGPTEAQAQAGGAGLIRFAYILSSITGKPSAI